MPEHGELQQRDILADGVPFNGADIDVPVSQHYWLQDHDSDVVFQAPPVQNIWYELFDVEDVRLIWHTVFQDNDENVAKDIEIRWTIDGTVYFLAYALADTTENYIYRSPVDSVGGTAGLTNTVEIRNAAYNVDKRGLAFKVEVRMTGVPGTNQLLISRTVRETLEVT